MDRNARSFRVRQLYHITDDITDVRQFYALLNAEKCAKQTLTVTELAWVTANPPGTKYFS